MVDDHDDQLDPIEELDRTLRAVREAIDDGLRRIRGEHADTERREQQ